MINAKDKEIERLCEDNRIYREKYLVNIKGLKEEEYQKISAEEIKPEGRKL